MTCGHCDETIDKKAKGTVICPLRDTNPADHTHAVCAVCAGRMCGVAPAEPAPRPTPANGGDRR